MYATTIHEVGNWNEKENAEHLLVSSFSPSLSPSLFSSFPPPLLSHSLSHSHLLSVMPCLFVLSGLSSSHNKQKTFYSIWENKSCLIWSFILIIYFVSAVEKKVNRNHGQVIEETVERSVWRRDWKSVTADENCHRRLSQQKSFKKDHWILTQKLYQGHQLPTAFQPWDDTHCFLANNNYFETIFTIPYWTFKVFHSLFYLPPWMHKILIVLCLWLPQY